MIRGKKTKPLWVSPGAHQRVKALASERGGSMGEALDTLLAEPRVDPEVFTRTFTKSEVDLLCQMMTRALSGSDISTLVAREEGRILWQRFQKMQAALAELEAANRAQEQAEKLASWGKPT